MSGIDFDSRISYEPYHIYYDLNILNNDTTGTKQPPFLQFTEIRNSPYINNPSDYFCSVVRFSVETPTLPLIIPQAKVGAANVDELVYTVSFNHPALAVPLTQSVFYIPQNNATLAPPPTAPVSNASDIINEYYYTYTYKPFIDMINTALRALWVQLLATPLGAQIIAITPYTADHFPYLWWDEDANIATWVALAQVFQTPTANNPVPTLNASALLANTPVGIFFNTELYNLFSSFSAFQNGYGGATPLGLNWRMNLPNTISVNPYLANVLTVGAVPPAPSLATYPVTSATPTLAPIPVFALLRVRQEYPTTPLWNPVTAIVFTTSLLPIASSIVSAPVLFGQGQAFTNAGNNSGIANILTDLEVPTEKGWQTKPLISYVPTAEYRLFDLNGNAPLSAIEITVNWKDTFGRLNQFRLGAGCNASIKLMFRRKDFQGVV
jgi:hypothetical protein